MREAAADSVVKISLIAVLCAALPAVASPVLDDFAEGNASDWGAFAADSRPATVADDASRVRIGNYSIRFDTESGFDTGVRYPSQADAHWYVVNDNYLVFWAYARNDTPAGFQGHQPIVVLKTATGDYRYEPNAMLMFDRAWHRYHIPLAGDETWVRTETGNPDLADVNQIEIHQDTWDSGFTIWYDGVDFAHLTPGELPPAGPPPPDGVDPDAIDAKALLFIFDPVMENLGGLRMHEAYGWGDPVGLAQQVIADLAASSHGRARYEIVETIVVDDYPMQIDGFRYDDERYDADWQSRTMHDPGMDYARFIADANLAARIESGAIDEVFLYGAPGFGWSESRMAGDGGYWCNSGPVRGVPSERLFVLMGWNFERGVAEAIHSFGHRAESVMVHSYGSWAPDRATTWNAFTLLDRDAPGEGSVGNVHFPVNGVADYDYGNAQQVWSDAADWHAYPDLTGERTWVDYHAWSPDGADTQRRYLNWWYDHMPHVAGRGGDYFLANWWRYLVDVDAFKGWDGNLYYSTGLASVAIASPANGAEVGGMVGVEVNAAADGALGRVDLYVDGSYFATDNLAPFLFVVDLTARTGPVTLRAKAYELQNGTEALSAPVVIFVSAPEQAPGEVSPPGSPTPLRFVDDETLTWAPAADTGAGWFNLYRGSLRWLRDGQAGSCRLAGILESSATDSERPRPGSAWFYIVTGETTGGEGPRGVDSSGTARPTTGRCP